MKNKKQLGKLLNKGMSNLSNNQIKWSILTSFMVYQQCILHDRETPKSPWFHFLDLVALMWGYYGDLDLHIDKMEERLTAVVESFKSRSDIEIFVQSVGDFKEEHDRYLENLSQMYDQVIKI